MYSPHYTRSVLNRLPTSRSCCFCFSPKEGAIIIAVLGLPLSILLIVFYEFGDILVRPLELNNIFIQIIIHVYPAIGVLLFALQIILLIASITYNEVLILMYLWYVIAASLIDILIVCYVAIFLIINENILLGVIMISGDLMLWLFVYTLVIPALNGFRMSIHTIRLIIT